MPNIPAKALFAEARNRVLVFSFASSLIARGLSAAAQYILAALLLPHLGTERFGVWAALMSFFLIASNTDLGIGNGLVNIAARSFGRDDHRELQRHISTALICLCLLGLAFGLLAALAPYWIDYARLLGVSVGSSYQAEVTSAMVIATIIVAVSLPVSVVPRIQSAIRLAPHANIWQASGTVIAVMLIAIGIEHNAQLPFFVAAFLGIPVVAQLLNGAAFFTRRGDLLPTTAGFSRTSARELITLGASFFAIQLSAALCFQADSIFVANYLGLSAVTNFAVAKLLFGAVSMLCSIALMPLWPAYAEAAARGDTHWVRSALRISFIATLAVASVLSVILLIGFDDLVHLWLGRQIELSIGLKVALACWTIVEALGICVGMYLNGRNLLSFQVRVLLIFVPICLCSKAIGIYCGGLEGLVLGTTIAFILVQAPVHYRCLRGRL